MSRGCVTATTKNIGSRNLNRFDFANHEKGKYVYCVAWNQKDARKIASGGGDGACMIHQTDGKLVQSFKHPGTVYGCDWNPNNENIIATACEDCNVRVFYVGNTTDQPLKILSGHSEKVFRVKWSPLKDGILCSTSDDCSVRVWHYARGVAVRVLEGHTSYTRGVSWCPELPNMVISGSWDSTMRVWDISDGACLDIIEDHGADVYGLACHPKRPFTLSSTSRDSTVRLWSMLPLVSSIYLKILTSWPLNDVFSPSTNQDNEGFSESFGLYGSQSKFLKDILLKTTDKYSINVMQGVTALFCPPSGTKNLWDLVLVLKGKEVEYSDYKNGICHRKHVIKLTTAKALEKELANVSFFGSGVNSCGKHKNLHTAAEHHLLTGNLKKYCELKIQLGSWTEAIALAPGVSLNYWKELTTRWLNLFKEENNELVAPFYIAASEADELVKHYTKQNFLEKANIVSIALSEGLMPTKSSNIEENSLNKDKSNDIKNYDLLIDENIGHMAERHMMSGSPVIAACWYLSNSNVQDAVYCLLRGNELELAISLCLCLEIKNSSFKIAITYIAWRCIQKKEWDLAIEVLNMCPGTEIEKACVCINCGLSVMERNDLHKKASLPLVLECKEYAKSQSSILETVQYYLLSDEPKKGLDIGLCFVKDALSNSIWNLQAVWKILRLMSCISSHQLQDVSFDRHRFELQAYSAYIGALIAIRQDFHPIVVPLFSTALSLIRRVHNANLAISEDLISTEMHAWMASKSSDFSSAGKEHTCYKELMSKISEDPPFGDIGVTFVSGSNLPRHSDHHRCYLKGTAIRGPVYFLDDSKSVISLNDALMWAKVNLFSPLKTGFNINPF